MESVLSITDVLFAESSLISEVIPVMCFVSEEEGSYAATTNESLRPVL
jgi:hypothetical protein